MNPVTFAATDISGLFWLAVIVVTVLAQIFKAGRQFNKNRPGQDQESTAEPNRAPEAELREFLKGLTGVPPAKPTAPVTRPPAPRPAPPRRVAASPRRVVAPPPLFAPPIPAAAQASVWDHAIHHDNAYAEARIDGSESTRKRKAVLAAMKDPRSLRQAFLLRTILGPPVTLR